MKLTFDKRAWWIGVQRVPASCVMTPAGVFSVSGWLLGLLCLQVRVMRQEPASASFMCIMPAPKVEPYRVPSGPPAPPPPDNARYN